MSNAKMKANDAFVLENVELFFTKVDPTRPTDITQDGKLGWETQIRTKDKSVAANWRNLALPVKAVREDKDDEESKILFWRTTIRRKYLNAKSNKVVSAIMQDEGISMDAAIRKAIKSKEIDPPKAPTVLDGNLEDVDPGSIGNGSVANVRVFQYDYSFKTDNGGMTEGVASVLMAIQVTTLMEYIRPERESAFTKTTTKVVSVAEQQGDEAPVSSKKASEKAVDLDDDQIPF